MKFNDTKETVEERTEKTNLAGGKGYDPDTPEMGLYKVVINNLLENKYYEDDEESFKKVKKRFSNVDTEFALKLANYARNEMGLRDISQLLLVLAGNERSDDELVKEYAPKIISRTDELNTVTAMQIEMFGLPMPKNLRHGVAEAFHQFDRYQFSKYQQKSREVSLVDTINIVHPRPETEEEEEIFEKLVKGDLDDYPEIDPLDPPKTWEVTISEKGNNKEAWKEVLPKMGIFAKIRNLRNMLEVGVDGDEIFDEGFADAAARSKIYPFRFYQAYKAVMTGGFRDETVIDTLTRTIDRTTEVLPDDLTDTAVAVDLSGSMDSPLSKRSNMSHKEIGALFGAMMTKNNSLTIGFGTNISTVTVHPDTPVLEISDKILNQNVGHSTNAWKSIDYLTDNSIEKDRIVIFTDEQVWDTRWGQDRGLKDAIDDYRENVNPEASLYIIDLSSYGELSTPEGYHNVYRISGWNSNVLDFIQYAEDTGKIINEIKDY